MNEIKITDRISYFPPTDDPLSSNIGIVRGNLFLWLYDVGNGPEALEAVNSLPGEKCIVLSHFHPDHTGNIDKLKPFNLFVGNQTEKHINAGNVIDKDMYKDDGVNIHVFPFPSCHAKGSLAMEINGEYVFVGDGLYPTSKNDLPCYNVGILLEQIALLKKIPSKYVLSSHREPFIVKKDEIIKELMDILTKKSDKGPYVFV